MLTSCNKGKKEAGFIVLHSTYIPSVRTPAKCFHVHDYYANLYPTMMMKLTSSFMFSLSFWIK